MSINQAVQSLRSKLKEKWIYFYRDNQDILETLGINHDKTWYANKDDDDSEWELPSSTFILGVLLALEPSLKDELMVLLELNRNADQLVKTLGCIFDVKSEVEKLSNLDESVHRSSETDHIHEPI